MTLAELKAKLDAFSPVKIEFVGRVMESLANPPTAEIKQRGTWLTGSEEWIEYFGLALSVHHSATTETLGLTAFETVFRNACEHLGWPIDPPGSKTQRFVDLTVRPGAGPERRLSLKSTAARNLSRTSLHISKLTEAAWIQDARTARDRRNLTQELFRQYQAAVTHIVMLRAFREGPHEVPSLYQLVEVSASIFDSVQTARLDVLSRDAPLIECQAEGNTVAVVAVDRSDSKITVRRVQLSACTVHAEWSRA
ncbi:MAG: hypothetical protein OXG65_03635 [Chloroflexi bacterium]|nr:hypothetical protein [Chloroflexota bacterium]